MNNLLHVIDYFATSHLLLTKVSQDEALHAQIVAAAEVMVKCLKGGGKIISCGNGGSMCDAMHFASELTGKYKAMREPLYAISLSDVSVMSCISNDFSYNIVFSRQILGLGNKGDVLLALSTSGASVNIIGAMAAANLLPMQVIGITGAVPPKEFVDECDVLIQIPSTLTNHIQETTIKILHILVELIEANI